MTTIDITDSDFLTVLHANAQCPVHIIHILTKFHDFLAIFKMRKCQHNMLP